MQRLSGFPAGSRNRSAWGFKSPVKLASTSKPFHYTFIIISISLPSRPPSSSIKGIYIHLSIATKSLDIYRQLTTQWPTTARTESSSRTMMTAQPPPSRAKTARNPPPKILPPRNPPAVPSPVLLPPSPNPHLLLPHPSLILLSRLRLRPPFLWRLRRLEDGIRHVARRQAVWQGTIRHRESGWRTGRAVGGWPYEEWGGAWGGCWCGRGQYGA